MPFPWVEHRSLAEVDETEALRKRLPVMLSWTETCRFMNLCVKERRHNPPPGHGPR